MKKNFFKRWRLRFLYFKRTGFYQEVGKGLLNFLLILAVLIVLVIIAERTFLDVKGIFNYIVENVKIWVVLLIFLCSESLLSPIPSDLFIIWCEGLSHPWLYLSILAVLSYIAGTISYSIGFLIRKNKKVNNYFTLRFEKHIKNSRKWGGWLIAAAALTPLPYSIIMVVVGMLNYPAKQMLWWNLFRIPRFYLYGLFLFPLINFI